jgi:hypothetical protein
MINIVNKYKHTPSPADFKIHRPSALGNPFTHLAGKTLAKYVVENRDAAVESFEPSIIERLNNNDPEVRAELNKIVEMEKKYGTVNLVCFCAPLRCHGEVIRKIIDGRTMV